MQKFLYLSVGQPKVDFPYGFKKNYLLGVLPNRLQARKGCFTQGKSAERA